MDAALEDQEPEEREAGEIEGDSANAEQVGGGHCAHHGQREAEGHRIEALGVEQSDDRDRADIVDDRDRH